MRWKKAYGRSRGNRKSGVQPRLGSKNGVNKFGAIKQIHPEHGKFDSKGEMERYLFLFQMQKSGYISELRRQVSYNLDVNGQRISRYIADYTYELADGTLIVEDFKGVETDVFKLKKKMVKAIHGIEISVIKKPEEWSIACA